MANLFISYSRVDTPFKNDFVSWLEDAFRSHFIWHDHELDGGDIWWDEIMKRIETSDIFIYLLSNESVQSEYCQAEFKEAQRLRKQIIPIQVRGRTQLLGDLSDIQFVDMKDGLTDNAKSRFRRTLEKRLSLNREELVEPLSPERTSKPANVVELERPPNAQAVDTPPLIIEFIEQMPLLEVLSTPFEWITIPKGDVTLNFAFAGFFAQHKTYSLQEFSISKYPITNSQYKKFIEDGGYDDISWWQRGAWEIKQREQWIEPRYWKDSSWNTENHPVIGVSWYEAVAFCEWLKKRSGENIHLPTEQQWQRAAQGDSTQAYPWGAEWNGERCNNNVSPHESTKTSSIEQYEGEDKGNSKYGVVDMSGNVWEWCNSLYDFEESDKSETNDFIVRGGSWKSDQQVAFHLAYRYGKRPTTRNNLTGFRIARLP